MSSRDLGSLSRIRVVAHPSQFEQWWRPFVQSVGGYPVVGLNCKWNSTKVLDQIDRIGLDLDSMLGTSDEDGLKNGLEFEGDYCSELDPDGELLATRTENARNGMPAMIQLASFGGEVLLIRSCFFKTLPRELENLMRTRVIKVGQGLEKDCRRMGDACSLLPANYLDLRNVCLQWPYLSANFNFSRMGVRSLGSWLFETEYPDFPVSPCYLVSRLDPEQVEFCALEVQLYVDIFTIVQLRFFGQKLPPSWDKDESFGEAVYLWNSPLFEKGFLDHRLRPVRMKDATLTAAKHQLCREIQQQLTRGGRARLATMWAWPVPLSQDALGKMMIREPGDGALPCDQYPFVILDLSDILETEAEEDSDGSNSSRSLQLVGTTEDLDGRMVTYTVSLEIEAVDPENDSSGDGGGRALDLETAFAQPENPPDLDEGWFKSLLPSVKQVASQRVRYIRDQMEWNGSEFDVGSSLQESKLIAGEAASSPIPPQHEEAVEEAVEVPSSAVGVLDSSPMVLGSADAGLNFVSPVCSDSSGSGRSPEPQRSRFVPRGSSGSFAGDLRHTQPPFGKKTRGFLAQEGGSSDQVQRKNNNVGWNGVSGCRLVLPGETMRVGRQGAWRGPWRFPNPIGPRPPPLLSCPPVRLGVQNPSFPPFQHLPRRNGGAGRGARGMAPRVEFPGPPATRGRGGFDVYESHDRRD